jgi:hypothetical protein
MATTHIDERLKDWATPRQAAMIDAVNALGSPSLAAIELGIKSPANITDAIRLVKAKAAAHGYSPEHALRQVIPAPFIAKGHSTYYDKSGTPTQQWVKSKLDDTAWLESVKSGVEAFVRDQEPVVSLASPPKSRDRDIIPFIQIGDAHFGMLAHEAETGANFDLKIAKRELMAGVATLIDESEPTDRIFINDVGDFTHYENMKGETEASGHRLDFDGRFPKMIDVYAETMRFIVEKALTKAEVVDIAINMGNHSRTNDIWMAVLLRQIYGHTGRVNVLNNRSPFIAYRMGRTFVMTHHSDKCTPNRLGHVMATDYAQDWGEARYRYIDIGHIHHNMVSKEHPGVAIESWNQLANKDQWAHDYGYRSRQSISIVERSRSYGEKRRRMLPIEEIRDNIEAAAMASGLPAPYRPTELRAFAA